MSGSMTTTSSMASTGTGMGTGLAADLAAKLGLDPHFLIGMGNDLANDHSMDGAYTLGQKLDLHYCYLVGLPGQGGWPDWNANGSFVNIMTDSADAQGVVPFFTIYMMAAWGENNLAALSQDGFMLPYLQATQLLFQRLGMFGKPAIVQIEPDFWAYAQQGSGGDPTSVTVNITNNLPDCAGLSDDLAGLGQCWVKLARMYAPKTVIGFHASGWADPDVNKVVGFLNAVGADQSDFVATDFLDRDAGCFEAGVDPNCQRQGVFYWDESNATSPNFHEHQAWSKTIVDGLKKPMIWWQTPFGEPSDVPGGSSGHYRDNRVHYIFGHIDEYVAAGGLAIAFGTGAGNQTYIDSDNGQFQKAVMGYFANPVKLP
jgi:hypothetical protein